MPSDLIRGWRPVRVKKTRQIKNLEPRSDSIGTEKAPETFNLDRLPTPIGTALLVTDADGLLRALDWEDYEPRMKQLLRLHYGAVEL